jgi:hypothetical protein
VLLLHDFRNTENQTPKTHASVQYLHEKEFPWDEGTCKVAARGGHLECMQYLHENGCPWDKMTYELLKATSVD